MLSSNSDIWLSKSDLWKAVKQFSFCSCCPKLLQDMAMFLGVMFSGGFLTNAALTELMVQTSWHLVAKVTYAKARNHVLQHIRSLGELHVWYLLELNPVLPGCEECVNDVECGICEMRLSNSLTTTSPLSHSSVASSVWMGKCFSWNRYH